VANLQARRQLAHRAPAPPFLRQTIIDVDAATKKAEGAANALAFNSQ
jgi:hypothetical protein